MGGRLPCAGAGPGRPDETAGAGDLGGHAVFARAEDVALGRIRMREDAVQSRAVWVHLLRLLCSNERSNVNTSDGRIILIIK